MSDKPKSVLDGMKAENKAFPRDWDYVGREPHRGIVGSCPVCGCPIYGSKVLLPGDAPAVTRSCLCQPVVHKTITDQMETK